MVPSGPVPGERLDELRTAVEAGRQALSMMRWQATRLFHESAEERLGQELAVVSRVLEAVLTAAESVTSGLPAPEGDRNA
ncbi:hypothetical protein [Embleya sp. AB8]|uniref:hypothetical protein n=1 Tax=Embleya sp. AB8 TaxID=3156304 RepID=UPI003C72907A